MPRVRPHTQVGDDAGGSNGGAGLASGMAGGEDASSKAGAGFEGLPTTCSSFVDAKPLAVPVLIQNQPLAVVEPR